MPPSWIPDIGPTPPPMVLTSSGGHRNTVGKRAVRILLECCLVTGCKEVVAKVMFLLVSVILSTGGVSGRENPPSRETPLAGRTPPAGRPPLAGRPPPQGDPWQGDPQLGEPPCQGEPPERENPPAGRTSQQGEPPPAGRPPGIRSMSGRYASYWNASCLL